MQAADCELLHERAAEVDVIDGSRGSSARVHVAVSELHEVVVAPKQRTVPRRARGQLIERSAGWVAHCLSSPDQLVDERSPPA